MSLFSHKFAIKFFQTDLQLLDEQFVDTSYHVWKITVTKALNMLKEFTNNIFVILEII